MHWFRSHHGAPTDIKWPVIAKRAETIPGHVVAVYWALLDHASQQADRGNIEGFDAESVGAFFGFPTIEVEKIISAFKEKSIIDQSRIVAWNKRQPKREDDSKDRVTRFRKRNVTHGNALKRPVTTEERRVDKNRTEKKETEEEGRDARINSRYTTNGANGHDKSVRGRRLDPSWEPSIEDREFCISIGLDPTDIAERFRDYWIAKAGAAGTKLDWSATWRNWCRCDATEKSTRVVRSGGGRSEPPSVIAAFARAAAKANQS